MSDPVNHPSHYTEHPSGVECIDITEHFNFNRGNAIKYIWRAGSKQVFVPTSTRMTREQITQELSKLELEDLKKARWYLDREITRLEG